MSSRGDTRSRSTADTARSANADSVRASTPSIKAGAIIRAGGRQPSPAPTELDALAEGARSLHFRKVSDDALVHASVDVFLRAHPDYWRRLPARIVWSDLDWVARAERLLRRDTAPAAKASPAASDLLTAVAS